MPRPSGHTDKQLIEAARKLFPSTGCSRLNVRQVAKTAGVNLGMFHYHFKSKEKFVQCVLQEFYEDFFKNFNLDEAEGHTPLDKLKSVVTKVGDFVLENGGFMGALAHDLMAAEPAAIEFAQKNVGRHAEILFGLVLEAQKAGQLEPLPPPQIVGFMMSGIIFPMFISARVRSLVKGNKLVEKRLEVVAGRTALLQRIDLAFKAITKAKRSS